MPEQTPSAAIDIRHLSKSFGPTRVLDSISLEVGKGEFFSLLGPSGCGKSTLLNILGGLDVPDRGTILIDGEDVTRLQPERRPTNMVFQNYAIFPHLNVERNIAYGLRRKRLDPREERRRVGEMLDLVHLGGMGRRSPTSLSGGQRQRVALARALIMEPKILLLDESLAALDKRLREAMQIELRQLQRQVGITFIFVTHDQDEAMSMSDRIAVMGSGRILQVNTPTRLYREPATRQVAEFIGSINLFRVRGTERSGEFLSIDAGPLGRLRAPACAGSGGSVLALRPESLAVRTQRPTDDVNAIEGRVAGTTFLGDRSFVRVAVPHHDGLVTVACSFHAADSLAEGQGVWISWLPTDGRLLPEG